MSDYTNNELLHVKCENGVQFIQFKKLNEYKEKIVHGIFLRHGGVSAGIYNSLNIRLTGKDDTKKVLENYNRMCEALNINIDRLCKANQAHTDNVIYISEEVIDKYNVPVKNNEQVDGYITSEKDVYTVVTTADCVPIIIYDSVKNVCANIHSGWKGTIQQIYLKAILKMKKDFNCNVKDMIVCLGPSIGKCCFTSAEKEFKEKFVNIWPNENEYITYDEDKFHIDMKKIIIQDLIEIGVKKDNISNANICTKCNNHDFFSYRVTTQNKEEDYGLFGTIIGIKK